METGCGLLNRRRARPQWALFDTSEEGQWRGICKQVVGYRTGGGTPMVGAVYETSEAGEWRGVCKQVVGWIIEQAGRCLRDK
jgi:hypothetical protein